MGRRTSGGGTFGGRSSAPAAPQKRAPPPAHAPAPQAALSSVVAEAEACLRPRALAAAADALGALLLDAVAMLDGGDEAQGEISFLRRKEEKKKRGKLRDLMRQKNKTLIYY